MKKYFVVILFTMWISPDAVGQKFTFYQDIQPIIHSKCATCHRPGGGAPFELITYEDVEKRTDFIRKVITSGYMPPWRADDHYTKFVNNRSLTDGEIESLISWIDAGAPRGRVKLQAETTHPPLNIEP